MYGVLYTLNKSYPGVRGGFMNIPFITEQVMDKRNMPSLTAEQIVRILKPSPIAVVQQVA